MRTPGTRTCGGCRYWSEMLAQSIGGASVEAMCLAKDGPCSGRYMVAAQTCPAFAFNTAGMVDEPPDYGEVARAIYAQQAAAEHPTGGPMFGPDGLALDINGKALSFQETLLSMCSDVAEELIDFMVAEELSDAQKAKFVRDPSEIATACLAPLVELNPRDTHPNDFAELVLRSHALIVEAIGDAFELGHKAAGGAIIPDVNNRRFVEVAFPQDEIDAICALIDNDLGHTANVEAVARVDEKIRLFQSRKTTKPRLAVGDRAVLACVPPRGGEEVSGTPFDLRPYIGATVVILTVENDLYRAQICPRGPIFFADDSMLGTVPSDLVDDGGILC